MTQPQQLSHYPSWPLPVLDQDVAETGEHACSYLPGRVARFRAFASGGMTPAVYQAYMDAGFRRSGRIIYQPMCIGCRACVPLRVPVANVQLTKSRRRILRRNADLLVRARRPEISSEKWNLYTRYQEQWHGKNEADEEGLMGFVRFLYESPVETLEMEYRDNAGTLLGVGICDVSEESLSSVYFYFDPAQKSRSLGTFSALYEMLWAREMNIPYWYAGYWVNGCQAMQYKSRFHPHELLGTDGIWHPPTPNNRA